MTTVVTQTESILGQFNIAISSLKAPHVLVWSDREAFNRIAEPYYIRLRRLGLNQSDAVEALRNTFYL
jgi:hypothetical protein